MTTIKHSYSEMNLIDSFHFMLLVDLNLHYCNMLIMYTYMRGYTYST